MQGGVARTLTFKVGTAQIIGILAGAAVDGDPETASWVAGNAQRYNDMMHFGGDWGAAAASLDAYNVENGATPAERSEALSSLTRGDGFDGPMPANALVQAWSVMITAPLVFVEAPVGVVGLGAGALISGGANIGYQLSTGEQFSYTDASIAAAVGAATQGKGFMVTQGLGLSGSYLGSSLKGEDPTYSLLGTAAGGVLGFKSGQVVTGHLKPYVGQSADVIGNMAGSITSEVVGGKVGTLGGKK